MAETNVNDPTTGEVTLPASSVKKIMSSLEDIKYFISKIEDLGSVQRDVVDELGIGATTDIPSVKAVNVLQSNLQTLNLTLQVLLRELDTKADKSHTSINGDNGIATKETYGHVKFASSLAETGDTNGLVLGYMLGKELEQMIAMKAEKSHLSEKGENGVADVLRYGHVKLTEDYSVALEEDGVVPTQQAMHNLYEMVSDRLLKLEIEMTGKATSNHASKDVMTIGGGNSFAYGHVKLTDKYTTSEGDAGKNVAASSEAVYRLYEEMNERLTEIENRLGILETSADMA